MLSPDDDDDEGSSTEEETDTCTEASFLDLLGGDGLFKISTWPPSFIYCLNEAGAAKAY